MNLTHAIQVEKYMNNTFSVKYCLATPEVDHSGVYCLEMFSQANDKWYSVKLKVDYTYLLLAGMKIFSIIYLPYYT